jgi:dUTP pyrophosphatase
MQMHPKATLPTRGSDEAAGLDLCAIKPAIILPGERTVIRTGIAVAIPFGFYGRIAPRSGLAVKKGLNILAGVIDSDYRGELLVCVINHGETIFEVEEGMRIAQFIVTKCEIMEPEWVDSLPESRRGTAGIGSTGNHS